MKLEDYPSLQDFGDQLRRLEASEAGSTLSRHPRRGQSFRWPAVSVAAVAMVVAVALGTGIGLQGGRAQLSFVQRAYAQVAQPGIAHWKLTIQAVVNGAPGTTQTEEGWSANGVTHTIIREVGGTGTVSERRIANGTETYRNGSGPVQTGPAGTTDLEQSLPGSDPVEAFRRAYDNKQLQQVSARQFQLKTTGPPGVTLTYTFDAGAASPEKLTETSDDGRQVEMYFHAYEHLSDTPQNQQLLQLGSTR